MAYETVEDVWYLKMRIKDKRIFIIKSGILPHWENITKEKAIKLLEEYK